ncbi:MAG: hypothetical protein ABIJ44_02965 [Pseudomonadota bacterium]
MSRTIRVSGDDGVGFRKVCIAASIEQERQIHAMDWAGGVNPVQLGRQRREGQSDSGSFGLSGLSRLFGRFGFVWVTRAGYG